MISSVIDVHSHILPQIDDGSASIRESLSLLHLEAQQGIETVIATPHFYPEQDDPERFLRRREAAYMRLKAAMQGENRLPDIKLGAEVYFFRTMGDSEALKQLTIDPKRCILIEMPHAPWTQGMYRVLTDVREKQDLIPVVAHVDRYIRRFHTYGIPEKLSQMPVLVQANASFFLDRSTSAMALRMLSRGQIHLIGSDCHNLQARPPRLGEAIELIRRKLGDDALAWIEQNQRLLLEDGVGAYL